MTDFYCLTIEDSSTLTYFKISECQPNDDIIQTFTIDNITTSTLNNELSRNRYSTISIFLNENLYRQLKTYSYNQTYINHEYSFYGFSYFLGDPKNELHVKDLVIANTVSIQLVSILVQTYGKAYFENVLVENVTNTDNAIFYFVFNFESITMSNITIRNMTGPSIGSLNDIFLFNDFVQTITIITQLYAYDIEISGRSLINSVQQSNQIQINNSVIESINISSSDYVIDTGLVKSFLFASSVISDIKTTDDINTNGAVLFINTLDLNSELDTNIQDVVIDDCEISFAVLSSVINEAPSNRSISFTNINFTNTHFESDRALLSTDRIQLETNLQISMSNFLFSNISFLTKGTLIE